MGRDWPPASVWLLCGVLVLPVAALFVWLVADGVDPAALAGAGLGLPVAAALLAGWRAGWWLGLLAVLYMLVGTAGALTAVLTGPAPGSLLLRCLLVAVPAGWSLTTAALLWWPATRRWCGRLRAADPEDGP